MTDPVSHAKPPEHCGRPMLDVISRSTSLNAYDRTKDTPVWWCPDCHHQIKREVPDGPR